MNKKYLILGIVVVVALAIVVYLKLRVSPKIEPVQNKTGLANPAAVYCEEQGGKSTIVTAADGSQSGLCVFSDGRKCEEWEFFRTRICK